ncbi:MAG: GNAT family N-acetyltransferase [Kiritimatiellae bacterium]|nr:GNAT family N-acetyltransferase [Kiritimatiellia bacterium]
MKRAIMRGYSRRSSTWTTGKVVGDLWVYRIENDRMAAVAIRLAPSRHGKGFGTETLSAMPRFCFEHTELGRLQAEVNVRNAASRHDDG